MINQAWQVEAGALLGRWGAAAVLALWHATLLVAVLILLDALLGRRIYPQVRLALWALVFVRLAAAPLAALGVPFPHGDSLALLPAPSGPLRAISASATVARAKWALALWAVGAASVVITLGVRHHRLCRTLVAQDRSIPATDPRRRRVQRHLQTAGRSLRLRRTPPLLLTTSWSTPAVLGALRPVVVMPVALSEDLPPAALHHVLLHELAHVRRRDPWLQAAGCALQAAYWYYPLLPWVRRRIAALCELCCDATVAERLRDRTDAYRRTLAECALRLPPTAAPALQLSLVAPPVGLFARLHHLDSQPWRTAGRRRWAGALTAGAAAACVLSQAAPPPAPLSPVMAAFLSVQRDLARENLQAAAAGQWRSCLKLQASALLLFGSGAAAPDSTSPSTSQPDGPKEKQ